jgi:hypothetical protein
MSYASEYRACDTCHILIENGWWLDLFSRATSWVGGGEVETKRDDFMFDEHRRVEAVGDGTLVTGGTWKGKIVPVGWWFDEADERWYPPDRPRQGPGAAP